MERTSGSLMEWLIPIAFIACTSWVVWHLPAFLLDWLPYANESMRDQVEAIYLRSDVTPNMAGYLVGILISSTSSP